MIRPHLAFGCTTAAPCAWARGGVLGTSLPTTCVTAGPRNAQPTKSPQTALTQPSKSPRLLLALRTVAHATILGDAAECRMNGAARKGLGGKSLAGDGQHRQQCKHRAQREHGARHGPHVAPHGAGEALMARGSRSCRTRRATARLGAAKTQPVPGVRAGSFLGALTQARGSPAAWASS